MKEKSMSRNLKEYYPGIRKKLTKSEIQAGEKMLKKYITAWMNQPELTEQEKEKIRQENLRLMKIGQMNQKRLDREESNRKEK